MLLLAVATIQLAGAQTTRRVPTDFSSIQGAVDASQDGDVVAIEDGLYLESVNVTKNITLRGVGQRFGSIVGGQGSAAAISLNNASPQIENVVLRNATAGVSLYNCNQPVVRNCLIQSNLVDGISTSRTTALTIDGCIVENNSGMGVSSVHRLPIRLSSPRPLFGKTAMASSTTSPRIGGS